MSFWLFLLFVSFVVFFFFFSSRRRHTRLVSDWSSDVCSSDLHRRFRRRTPRLRRAQTDTTGRRTLPVTGHMEMGIKVLGVNHRTAPLDRSEERRVGKECRWRWATEH